MRISLRVLVAVTSILTVISPASTGHATSSSPAHAQPQRSADADLAEVHRLIYAVSLREFMAAVDTGDPWFDWSTDWCSAPLVESTGRSFDFSEPCRRHDFGYRNLQLLDQRYGTGNDHWNSTTRKRVDKRLLADMKAHCRTRVWHDRPPCRAWAQTFYAAVRVQGGP